MRPDWRRWASPEVRRFLEPGHEHSRRQRLRERNEQEIVLSEQDLAIARRNLAYLRSELAALKAEIKFRQLLRKAGFNPDQPRVPAGSPDGGQWTSEGGSEAGNESVIPINAQFSQAELPIQPIDVTIETLPDGVKSRESDDPLGLLGSMSRVLSSTTGIGVVAVLSGQVSDIPNGFGVTDGTIGIVAQDANSNTIRGAIVTVPGHTTAVVTRTPGGHVSVSFARNL